jgi:hypothetical protein
VNETELREELKRELHRAPVWQLEPDHVERKATGFRRRRRALTALTVVVAVGAAAGSVVGLARLGHGSGPGPVASGPTAPATTGPVASSPPAPGPATIAEFTCTDGGIQPSDVIVAAGPAGVTVAVADRSAAADMIFTLDNAGGGPSPDGGVFDYPGGGHAWPLAPGDHRATCSPTDGFDPQSAPRATLHVEDPDGYWVSDVLDCTSAFTSFVDYAGDGSPLPEALHEVLDGYARDGDVIRHVGYPDAHNPEFVLDRDGSALLRATMWPAKKGYVPNDVTGCAKSGHGSGSVEPPILPY